MRAFRKALRRMEGILSADVTAKLTRIARERGIGAEVLARETIRRLVDYDDSVARSRKAWRRSSAANR